jgi:hypothetical protein
MRGNEHAELFVEAVDRRVLSEAIVEKDYRSKQSIFLEDPPDLSNSSKDKDELIKCCS